MCTSRCLTNFRTCLPRHFLRATNFQIDITIQLSRTLAELSRICIPFSKVYIQPAARSKTYLGVIISKQYATGVKTSCIAFACMFVLHSMHFVKLGTKFLATSESSNSSAIDLEKLRMTQSAHHTLTLSAFTVADYAGQGSDRKSISAAAIHLNDLLVSWYCSSTITLSIEIEFCPFCKIPRVL
jgi:hypothetical protein